MAVRFVYFDLGNVLIRFSIQRMLYQVAALTEKPEAEIRDVLFDGKRYYRYEKGDVTASEYFAEVCAQLDATPDVEDFIAATNDIFWVNEPMLPVVRRLAKSNFPRGVLSNTNPMHWKYVETAFPRFWNYFPAHKIASFEAKALKPFREIYEIALAEARKEIPDLQPNEILLIDDLEANVVAAAEFGFQTIHYVDHDAFLAEMTKLGLPTE